VSSVEASMMQDISTDVTCLSLITVTCEGKM